MSQQFRPDNSVQPLCEGSAAVERRGLAVRKSQEGAAFAGLKRGLSALVVVALVPGALLTTGLAGCATKGIDSATISDSSRRAYYEAMDDLVAGNFPQATQQFQLVSRGPRYVRYSALAKIRIADAMFLQGRFQEAAALYRVFLSQFKSDPNVPYARFHVAKCFYERVPDGWFATPPDNEMDHTVTRQAEAELKGFVSTYPTSRFSDDARRMLSDVRGMLFSQELYVADFYEARGKWRAVAWRLDRAMDIYPEFAMTDALVWRMARAYTKAGDTPHAAQAYGLYLKNFPSGSHRGEAKARVDALRRSLDAPAGDNPGEEADS